MFRVRVMVGLAVCALTIPCAAGAAAPLVIEGPPDSGRFGHATTVLPNGNLVVTDPEFDLPDGTQNVGAAYLYAPDGTLISTLTGSSEEDRVGSVGNVLGGQVVTVLASGNYVVASQNWGHEGKRKVGAVTFGNAVTGVSGVVGPENSLIGSTANDAIGHVTALATGNYLVAAKHWDNAGAINAGAVAFGNGQTGTVGAVSALNALVGTAEEDLVGWDPIVLLASGNYVVPSSQWNHAGVMNAGAVTFGDGQRGVIGPVGPHNSLVGSTENDLVGLSAYPVVALPNGNYVVSAPLWDRGAVRDVGAVALGDGLTGTVGVMSAANSLVGSTADDHVGIAGVKPLLNNNYVVVSQDWDRGAVKDAGAVTWASGERGVTGDVSAANSLVGSHASDFVGSHGVLAVGYGNYVVASPKWDSALIPDAGAATFGDGSRGTVGPVDITNSLVGSTAFDGVGLYIADSEMLSNGNYVVLSPTWDSGPIADVGAATFGDGAVGVRGVVDAGNSWVGSQANDRVGTGVVPLHDGAYLVRSAYWANGREIEAGALTFVGAQGPHAGVVSEANSLVGSTRYDWAGFGPVRVLQNGNYVVTSPTWDNAGLVNAGAVTLGDGEIGIQGPITPANSLVGTQPNDYVGAGQVITLPHGDFVVGSPLWNRQGVPDEHQGAATYLSGTLPLSATITAENSLMGALPGDRIGDKLLALPDGRYVVIATEMDAASPGGIVADIGAVVLGKPVGEITADNAALGKNAGSGPSMVVSAGAGIVAVGRPGDNEVSVFGPLLPDAMFQDGFE